MVEIGDTVFVTPINGLRDNLVIMRSEGAGGYIMVPNITTDERDALTPNDGMIVYNTDSNNLEAYIDGEWVPLIPHYDQNTIPDGSAYGTKFKGIAGETLAFGDLVFYKSDGKWWKTDGHMMTKSRGELAIADETIAVDTSGDFDINAIIRNDDWSWTVGSRLYVSGTLGSMTETILAGSGDQIRKVGVALTSSVISFAPDCTIIELA